MDAGSTTDPIARHLLSGEKVQWSGRPDPSRRFTRADWYLVPFSVMWGGFAIFWEAMVLRDGGPTFMALWGIPFVVLGLYFVVGRFAYKARQKRRTWYAITNQRTIIVQTGSNGDRVEAAFLKNVPSINQSIDRSDTGSIIFGNMPAMMGMYMNSGMDFFARQHGQPAVAFFDVPQASQAVAVANEQIRSGAGS